MLLNIKPFAPLGRNRNALYQKHDLIPSETVEVLLLRTAKHRVAYPTLFHTLIEDNIAATLPVEELHASAVLVHEYIHAAVGWLQGVITYKTTQWLYSLAEIYM